MPKQTIDKLYTHDGHPLTAKEDAFINAYIETNNGAESARRAGYTTKTPEAYAIKLKGKDYIAAEISHRIEEIAKRNKKNTIATGEEILQFFSDVMNGKIKDQFGLDAPLSERTKAADLLAKRTVDFENKTKQNDNTLTVNLIRHKKK